MTEDDDPYDVFFRGPPEHEAPGWYFRFRVRTTGGPYGTEADAIVAAEARCGLERLPATFFEEFFEELMEQVEYPGQLTAEHLREAFERALLLGGR